MSIVKKNKYGFHEVSEKPSEATLREYYDQKYYQQSKGQYQKEYTPNELKFISNRIGRKFEIVLKELDQNKQMSFLDVGCGEGWSLNYFSKKGWKVRGLDYSDAGCKSINPDMIPYLTKGNIYDEIDTLIDQNEQFDVILLDNVLEHVLDPFALLVKLKSLARKGSIIIIEVPNDFSELQQYLIDQKKIDKEFWVVTPDHISYFNKQGLINLLNESGWDTVKISTDYPIDFNLFNEDSNYAMDKSKGKNVHFARVEIENLLDSISTEKANAFYESLADLGLGRNLIGFFKNR